VTETRAAIYTRISLDRADNHDGVRRQEQDCRTACDQCGFQVVGVYSDNDISAFSGKIRPDYERLLTDVKAGRVDVVVAWHPDRLNRTSGELERYMAICKPLGVTTKTVRGEDMDPAKASGRLIARINGAVASHESEQKGERVQAQKRQAQADGKWLGGQRPFGYAPDGYTLRPTVEQLEPIFRRIADHYPDDHKRHQPMPDETQLANLADQYTAEADAIADAARRALAGESLRSLFRKWNAAGLTTATGQPWTSSKIRQMLLRPRNAGLSGGTRDGNHFKLRVVGPAKWEPIIDVDTWEALRAKLTDPGRQTHQGNLSQKLVGSFLYYCECGQRLRSGGTRAADGKGRYACPTMHLGRAAGQIDAFVFDAVEEKLVESGIKLMPATADVSKLRAKADALRIRADEIASLFADPDAGMTATQFKVSNERVQTQLRALDTEIGVLTAGNALAGIADAVDPVSAFRGAGIERQRAVIDALMTVTISRLRPSRQPDGSYFDPASVDIKWKTPAEPH
jgi:DNA invertase Pin-like site-specific DNA recombinase